MATVLIGYWTRTGTTKEYAEMLGQVLEAAGHRVDIKPLAEIFNPGSYDAIVLGAPINGMRPVPELLAFIAANADELAGKPTALFTVSYMFGKAARGFSAMMEKGTSRAAAAMGATLSTILPGRLTAPTPTLMRIVFGIPKDLPLDRMNPAGMKAWAKTVVGILPH